MDTCVILFFAMSLYLVILLALIHYRAGEFKASVNKHIEEAVGIETCEVTEPTRINDRA